MTQVTTPTAEQREVRRLALKAATEKSLKKLNDDFFYITLEAYETRYKILWADFLKYESADERATRIAEFEAMENAACAETARWGK